MNLKQIQEEMQNKFKASQQVLSFEEYCNFVSKNSVSQVRGSAEYAADMMDHYGNIFDKKVVGNKSVQKHIYQALRTFSRLGMNHRLILLHGPNGSAKSTIVSALMDGMENYSHTLEGALYTFSWIFPVDRVVRGSLGIRGDADRKSSPIQSYATLNEEDIACIIPSELKDHPLLLLPLEAREKFLKDLDLPSKFEVPQRLKLGGLSHRDQSIFQALLTNYQGDYSQVLKHIRVERFYLSRVYRSGFGEHRTTNACGCAIPDAHDE
jgi:serine protein kinase